MSFARALLRSPVTRCRGAVMTARPSTLLPGRVSMMSMSSSSNADKPNGTKEASSEKEPAPAEKSKEDVLAEKDRQIASLQDHYRRALADAENVRQRTKREIDETAAYSISKFAKDLLDTSDFLSMALASVSKDTLADPANKALADLHQGVTLTRNELHKTFKKYGITEYSPLGESFDPNLHNALYQSPQAGKFTTPGSICSVQKTGFKIQDRVLRAAQVGVVQDSS